MIEDLQYIHAGNSIENLAVETPNDLNVSLTAEEDLRRMQEFICVSLLKTNGAEFAKDLIQVACRYREQRKFGDLIYIFGDPRIYRDNLGVRVSLVDALIENGRMSQDPDQVHRARELSSPFLEDDQFGREFSYYYGFSSYLIGELEEAKRGYLVCAKKFGGTHVLKSLIEICDELGDHETKKEAEVLLDAAGSSVPFCGDVTENFSPKTAHGRWARPERINFFPLRVEPVAPLSEAFKKFILNNYPYPKLFDHDSRLITLGSCFAEALRQILEPKNFLVESVTVPAGIDNTFALASFFDWLRDGEVSQLSYAYQNHNEDGVWAWSAPEDHAIYQRKFAECDGIVITVGLAEIWEDSETGNVFWKGVPKSVFEAGRHHCRLSTVEENSRNLKQVVEGLRQWLGDIPIIFTLSPVPLNATFREMSCMEADCVSKSILRVALDNLLQLNLPNLYYWPSFEMVRWVGSHVGHVLYHTGFDEIRSDTRHPPRSVSETIVGMFEDRFFKPELRDGEM